MNPLDIIQKFYKKDSKAYDYLITHSKLVTKKALEIANNAIKHNPDLKLDIDFIKEAGMLHDIGIIRTNARDIGCYGEKPYIEHGVIGRQMLEKLGLNKHAKVCERHIGVGLTVKDIEKQKLPLPKRDMRPKSDEEKIICLADKFYSKYPAKLKTEKSLEEAKESIAKFGRMKLRSFESLLKKFSYS